ncbi:MAG TPA: peptidylprolyl isomerase, partial [Anaerolineales bacterium]|nr:peptidylprolyl isomerase [Anaerolineales bacterium]
MPSILATASPSAQMASGCSVVAAAPTQAVGGTLISPNLSEPALGPVDATVTMLFYCDLQSPECEIFNRVTDQLMKEHGRDLRMVYRPYPVPESAVPSLDKSVLSARALYAADNQGRFWEMRELLHTHYADWTPLSKDGFRAWLVDQAPAIHLDTSRFAVDYGSEAVSVKAQNAYDAAVALGISSIPAVFINGQLQSRAALSYVGLDSTIGLIALGAHQFRSCPLFNIDTARQYAATLHTEKGDIVIALDAVHAPLAVNSFVFLSQQGWYDGSSFHRVIPGFLAQAGDPSATGNGGPGYYFVNEITADARFDRPGVVGMVNSGPDTNGSQFFITYAPQPQLDGSYTVLGHVVKGMQVVESLTERDPLTTTNPPPGDKILGV